MRSPLMPLCRPLALCSIRFSRSNVSTAIITSRIAIGGLALDTHFLRRPETEKFVAPGGGFETQLRIMSKLFLIRLLAIVERRH